MGTKLNWGAALNSLADSLRTYAAMQQREQEIKQEGYRADGKLRVCRRLPYPAR